MANYIQTLQAENIELKAAIEAARDELQTLRAYLASPKFTGEGAGELCGYVSVADVENRLQLALRALEV